MKEPHPGTYNLLQEAPNGARAPLPAAKKEDALQAVFNYYMKEQSGDPLASTLGGCIIFGTELFGASAGVYYIPPALTYAADKSLFEKISFAAGNTVGAICFLFNATDGLLQSIAQEHSAPPALKDFLTLPSKKTLLKKNSIIFAASAICSVPLGLVAFIYPFPGVSKPIAITMAVHSGLANMVLHAVACAILLKPENRWTYRLPFAPLEAAYARYQQARLSRSARYDLAVIQRRKEEIYAQYKTHLIQLFAATMEKIADDQVKKRGMPEEERQRSMRAVENCNSFSELVALADLDPPPEPRKLSCLRRSAAMVHRGFSHGGAKVAGAAFMSVGAMGWIVDPYYIGRANMGLDITESALFSFLPAYSTAVLLAFYGAELMERSYLWLTNGWNNPANKLPLEARRYPKTFALFMVVNAYLSFFSYATAQQLITTIFGDEMWDAYRPHLRNTATPAMQLISFIPTIDLFVAWTKSLSAKYGTEENKFISRLQLKTQEMLCRLQQLKGEELMASIERLTEAQQIQLRIKPAKFNADMERLDQPEKLLAEEEEERSHRCCGVNMFGFFSHRPRSDIAAPLLERGEEDVSLTPRSLPLNAA
jgi:hypothetical protein